MKVGDKVRFLDSVGGGVISRIDTARKLVYVSDEDGFESPTAMSQVVVVNNVKPNNIPMTEKELLQAEQPKQQQLSDIKPQPAVEYNQPSLDDVFETDYGDVLNVQLAFVPQNIRLLQSTPYDAVLVNDSNYFLSYVIAQEVNSQLSVVSQGLLEPNMTDTFTTIDKDSLNDWEHIHIQIIPFKSGKPYKQQRVIDVDLKLNLVNFFKLHAFAANEYFETPAWLINLVESKKNDVEQALGQLTQKYREDVQQNKPNKVRHRRLVSDQPLEVDLHINQLLDNTNGLSNGDMLQYQLDTFHRVMKENISQKGKKIVFIHGKGEGVLRKSIEDALHRQYKTCRFQDASFQKYGFGATMVIIS